MPQPVQQFMPVSAVLLSVVFALGPSRASADTITINFSDSGAYNAATGSHSPQNETYIAGLCPASDCALSDRPFRNFFVFDLGDVSERVVAAKLRLNAGSVAADGTYTLYDV